MLSVIISEEILNLEGHPNRFTGLRVTVIFPNGWISPVGGASAVEGLRSTGLPLAVSYSTKILLDAPNNFTIRRIHLSKFSGMQQKNG